MAPGGDSPMLLNAPSRHRSRTAFMALIGAAAVAAVVAFFIVLLSPASQHPLEGSGSTGDTVAAGPITTLAGPQNTVPPSAQAAGHSMVELQATTAHGTVALVGVAVAEGGRGRHHGRPAARRHPRRSSSARRASSSPPPSSGRTPTPTWPW